MPPGLSLNSYCSIHAKVLQIRPHMVRDQISLSEEKTGEL